MKKMRLIYRNRKGRRKKREGKKKSVRRSFGKLIKSGVLDLRDLGLEDFERLSQASLIGKLVPLGCEFYKACTACSHHISVLEFSSQGVAAYL